MLNPVRAEMSRDDESDRASVEHRKVGVIHPTGNEHIGVHCPINV